MVYCVWYPSGGFGHFVNAILTLYGDNFVRPKKSKLNFSSIGDSHDLDLVVPKYSTNQSYNFDHTKNYAVLVDNGINNESNNFMYEFNDATILKICYSDNTWPIVARTVVEKAMHANLDQEISLDKGAWHEDSPWSRREKYFLYLRDHAYRSAWKPSDDCQTIMIDDLLSYDQFSLKLNVLGIKCDDFIHTWQDWHQHNNYYIQPVKLAQQIIDNVTLRTHTDLDTITDLWTQAVVNYFIWLNFGFEVPANDYADWFTNTKDIVIMLDTHGIEF